ncbi:MAG: sulfatase-like hydrolase/transferase [Hyphomicrobiaceae bacterium]
MTDQTVVLQKGQSRLSGLRALRALFFRPAPVRPTTAWAIAAFIVGGLMHQFWTNEGELPNIVFTAGVTMALVALVVVISRRVLFSLVLTGALIATIAAVASVKRATMNMVVHAYDLFFYLSSWSTISYMWSDHRRYVLGLLGALIATAMAARIAYHADSIRVGRLWSAVAGILFIVVAWYGAEAKGERRHMQFYYENLYVSSFYASWAETLETLWRGALLEAAPKATAATPAFSIPAKCDTNAKPPHIILIHQESVVQPSLFKQLSYDHAVDQLFLSADSNLHQMRVETYGGASWLTEFSLLAGVSTHSFGGMRQFVQTFTQNKLKDTLPQALERCGYRNVVFYPMMRNFVSNDKFYTSIGLREIFDMKSQGAATAQERDRFYYDNSLAELDRHIQASHKPMFLFLQTMSAHWPYDFAFSPEVEVSGGGPGTEPEMHEYLRRVSIAKMDFDHLMAELPRRFPGERFLVVHYGDHHPMATRMLLGFNSDTQAEDVAMHPDSIGFVTYYAARGVNYRVPTLPQFETLDVPYVSTVILDLASLPLSDSHKERKRLMYLCKGRYNGCAQRNEILVFHRRLIDSGIMAAR